MKVNELKKILKEVIRETFREEIKDILLEAVKGNKGGYIPKEEPAPTTTPPPQNSNLAEQYRREMAGIFNEMGNKNQQPSKEFEPRMVDTTAEGSALPEGEVSWDQINSLIGK